ncbi:MAG: PfkB family carbohydrate kinase [Firmicutes bacterium]|nr:PfkB family carbohydrate kinase [Bacillota bacterium]
MYRRILTIQDISCVGQCSTTVALPILSACGLETCILPTVLLSTHTGGFGKPAAAHFDGVLSDIWHHWLDNGITFDAILVGYLGSLAAVEAAGEIMDRLLAPGGITIVDPAMADHGKLYAGFDDAYARQIGLLCRKADILLPNVTEAAILSGLPYGQSEQDELRLLKGLNHRCVVLTGADFGDGQTGVLLREQERIRSYRHRRIGGGCHGTGDIFAAAFTGVLLRGKEIYDAVRIAADFTYRCIENTAAAPSHWYGVKFEPVLPELIAMLA